MSCFRRGAAPSAFLWNWPTVVTTLFIEPASPWENGYIESLNGKLRDEPLNGEVFFTLQEAQILIGQWRHEYNHIRPHSSLGGRPPAPETIGVHPLSLTPWK